MFLPLTESCWCTRNATGLPLRDAYEMVRSSSPLDELCGFGPTAILSAKETGGNLAVILDKTLRHFIVNALFGEVNSKFIQRHAVSSGFGV